MFSEQKKDQEDPSKRLRAILDNDPEKIKAYEKLFGSIDNPTPAGLTALTSLELAKEKAKKTLG